MTTVLVAYASLHGATAGIAGWVADELRSGGLDAWAVPAAHVTRLDDIDAVVIGSAVYVDQWVPEAADLVRTQAEELRRRPVWLFSSGTVGGVAPSVVPAEQQQLASLVGARGSATFAGALDRPTSELAAPAGDWRDEHDVRRWAREIAAALTVVPSPG